MNPVDAIRLMVRHYPGGVEAIAVLLAKSPETLRHEISGKDGRYKLGTADACAISEACIAINSPHCHAFANAIAANCGGFVQLEVREQGAGKNLLADTAGLLRETSDVVTRVTEALADGHISDNDRKAVEREITEAIQALQKVQSDLAAAHSAGKLRAV